MTRWTALVLAGSRPGGDAFADSHGVALKALIPVGGEPMILRPIRSLLAAPAIGRVIVLTQRPELIAPLLSADERVSVEPSSGTIAETLTAICASPSAQWPLLVTTADHALLTPAMIEQFTAAAAGADVAVGMVERSALLARLPETRRTWIRLRGGAYSGANLFALGNPSALKAIDLWRGVEQDRKKGWRLLLALGPGLLIGAVLRLRTIDQTAKKLGRRLGLAVRPVIMSDPLACVDVDKPDDHRLVEELLAGA